VKNGTEFYNCNDNLSRSKWCHGKNTDSDYYKNNYHTGVTRKFVFEITNTTLVYDGTGPKLALAINGQVPGPAIEANWGDMVEVTFINKLQDNSTAIHFHGIRQDGTNDQDGVPGVTECAIAGNGGTRKYTWHASSYGTSWYHSHMFAQTADGIRGPIVIHGPATANYDLDMGTVMLDDT
jgi:FtsP/CotA-like multicopper oxidase with cupredoxin domain